MSRSYSRLVVGLLCAVGALGVSIGAVRHAAADENRPNIVVILADDLGYGDVQCLNSAGKITTPHMDRLAAEGMTFTDAHSSSAVCTPTRYGLLTGRYNWRSALKSGVLWGYSPRLIEPNRMTLASLLKDQGYRTACVGKWHLGMDWPLKEGGIAQDYDDSWKVDYTGQIKNGPLSVGFDYFYGISASLDMPPYMYIENDRTVGVPTVEKTWIRKGPAEKDFEAIDVLPQLTEKAVSFIDLQSQQGAGPWLLYFPLNAPHTPILPAEGWQEKSKLNPYGDFVMQVDDTVGQILAALDRNGVSDSTLVIFTSDNGCSPRANFEELGKKGHDPSYVFRGHKADIFDGGHRVPFLVRWPKRVAKGTTSDQTVCLNDIFATAADVVGAKVPDNAGEDSVSLVPAFENPGLTEPLHEAVVHHSINGSFAIRQGKWKLLLCPDSGGWSSPRPGRPESKGLPEVQLYDLSSDIGEETNVAEQNPKVVAELTSLLEKFVSRGRSTPGEPQSNTGDVQIHR